MRNFWGTRCFTVVKTLDSNTRMVRLYGNYGERGDTLILIDVQKGEYSGYKVK